MPDWAREHRRDVTHEPADVEWTPVPQVKRGPPEEAIMANVLMDVIASKSAGLDRAR